MPGNEVVMLQLSSTFVKLYYNDIEYKLINDAAIHASLKRHLLQTSF
jgi:hypothetical protein